MSLPIVYLQGTPYEQGRQHGAALRERIAHNLTDPRKPPTEHYITNVSAIMDLEARTLSISDGPPCASAYEKAALL
ncbi:MAG: hypothetical protein ACJ8CR_25455 [Roseiflexaceae bacterium]